MNVQGPSRDQLLMLLALQKKNVYAGTVGTKVIAKRRAKNRVAKQSRKVNR